MEYEGNNHCLHHFGQELANKLQANMAIVYGKIVSPPTLTSFDDVEAELATIWGLFMDLGMHLDQYNDMINRGIRDGRLYA